MVNGKSVKMELDTGAAVSIISEEAKVKEFPGVVLWNSDVILRTYTTQQLPVVGVMDVQVNCGNHSAKLLLYVVKVLKVTENATPKFCKPRSVPYAIKEAI